MKNNKKQILIIENEYYLGQTLAKALEIGLGDKVDVFVSNFYEDALTFSKSHDLDLVISEIRMPRRSGIELVKEIRQDHPNLPAILISDYHQNIFDHKNENPVADGYLTKPFELLKLFEMVNKILDQDNQHSQNGSSAYKSNGHGHNSANPNQNHNPDTQSDEHPRILVMEDDPGLRRIYKKSLGGKYEVYEAATLQEARELLDQYVFDIFICDIHLGKERGTDLFQEKLEKLRADGTQTIMASAYGNYRIIAQEMGAEFFLEKPISIGTLLQLIDRLISSSKKLEVSHG